MLHLIPLALTSSGPSFQVHGWVAGVIIAAAVCGAIYTIFRFLGSVFKWGNKSSRWMHSVNSNAEIAPELRMVAELAPLVHAIGEEFKNNGGNSLRDALDRNTALTQSINKRLDKLTRDIAIMFAMAKAVSEVMTSDPKDYSETIKQYLKQEENPT